MSDARRAAQAKLELRETEKAFEAVRQAMIGRLFDSPLSSTAEREQLYLGVQALTAVRDALIGVIAAGDLEDAAEQVRTAFGLKQD